MGRLRERLCKLRNELTDIERLNTLSDGRSLQGRFGFPVRDNEPLGAFGKRPLQR